MPRPLHVLDALEFNPTKAEIATEAAIPSPSTTWFACFWHGFEAACQVMSGICVGLSSFFRASGQAVFRRMVLAGWA